MFAFMTEYSNVSQAASSATRRWYKVMDAGSTCAHRAPSSSFRFQPFGKPELGCDVRVDKCLEDLCNRLANEHFSLRLNDVVRHLAILLC